MASPNLQLGERYRYSKKRQPSDEKLDGMLNFFHATSWQPDEPSVQLESGINAIAESGTGAERRRPAILLRSSPWKAGTTATPWHDVFATTAGRAIYFGDHKASTTVPFGETPGNKAMASTWLLHRSDDYRDRLLAPPIVVFRATERTTRTGRRENKGAVEFLGLTLITNASTMTTSHQSGSYRNMMFELEFLPMDSHAGLFD